MTSKSSRTDERSEIATEDATASTADGSVRESEPSLESSIDVLRDLAVRATELLDEYLGAGRGEGDKHVFEDLADVVREADELLAAVDLPALLDAVDLEDLPDAVDGEALPEAVRTLRPQDAVAIEKLLALVDLRAVFEAVDLREVRRNHRELGAELDDLAEYLPADEDGAESDDPPTESAGSSLDGESKRDLLDSDEAKQVALQEKVDAAVVEMRAQLLEAHETMRERIEANDLPSRRPGAATSLNPTARSSVPRTRPDVGAATRVATVPAETRHSSAPNYERIYGNRFRHERFRTPER